MQPLSRIACGMTVAMAVAAVLAQMPRLQNRPMWRPSPPSAAAPEPPRPSPPPHQVPRGDLRGDIANHARTDETPARHRTP